MNTLTFTLSRTAKSAIQTGLAMTIAYGIALGMGWDRPMWAGFAVIVLCAVPIGASLNKATLRMAGTMVAVVFSLLLIALFNQDRWLFILFLSIYVGICTYMMGGPKNQYFWFVTSFVCAIICFDAGPNSIEAFSTAMMRAEETALGILVYSIISIFLWPNSAITGFNGTAETIAANQHLLYRASMDMKGEKTDLQALKSQAMGSLAQFPPLLEAAGSESYDIKQQKHRWNRYQQTMNELGEILGRWNNSAERLDTKTLIDIVSNFTSFDAELERRFLLIQSMLKGEKPDASPSTIVLTYDSAKVDALSHLNKAELYLIKLRLERLESLTRALFDCVSVIKGFSEETPVMGERPKSGLFDWVIDVERLKASLRLMSVMWVAFVAVIYVRDFPAGFTVMSMLVSMGMNVVTNPMARAAMFVKPVFTGLLIGSTVYIFIMPQLSTYVGLGLVMFLVTFSISYFYSAPQQALSKMFGLIMFITVIGVSNVQAYSFVGVASTALMLLIALLFIYVSEHIPFTTRPEKVCLQLLGRFFRASKYVMATLNDENKGNNTWWVRCKSRFFEYELSTLPGKIKARASLMDVKYLPNATPAHMDFFNTSLQSLAFNIKGLYEAQRSPGVYVEMRVFHDEMGDWVNGLREALDRLSQEPTATNQLVSEQQLTHIMNGLDTQINRMLDNAGQYSSEGSEGQYLYPLLAAYQGLSYALADYLKVAGSVDWPLLLEERFT